MNNAAIYEESRFLDSTFEDWQRVWRDTIEANLVGPANVIFHAGRSMARRGGGVIVCVSSRGAFRGEPDAPAYGASKAGLNQLSQSAAKALAPSNVVVGVVAPGFVDTAMAAKVLNGPRGARDLPHVPIPLALVWSVLSECRTSVVRVVVRDR